MVSVGLEFLCELPKSPATARLMEGVSAGALASLPASVAPELNHLLINVSDCVGTWTCLGINYPDFCQGLASCRLD